MIEAAIFLAGISVYFYLFAKLGWHATIYFRQSSIARYRSQVKGGDSWALITGSTAGIGFGFAQELCNAGFNIIIHGKDKTELLTAQAQLSEEFPLRKIRTLLYDASGSTAALASAVHHILQDIRLKVLINNVGGQGGQTRRTYQKLQELSTEEVERVIKVNTHFATQITRILLPTLAKNQPSLVMNISSLSATGLPYLTVYAASKSYIDAFTRSLHAEMQAEGTGVDVMGVICGNVQSEGHKISPGLFVPTSRTMASEALKRVGCHSISVIAYWPHALQAWGFNIIPEIPREWISIKILRTLKVETDERENRVKGD